MQIIELITKYLLILLISIISLSVNAQNKGEVTGFNIPRFVSIKSDDSNLRVGPSMNYPILIKYIQKNMPLEIVDEYDVWRQVKDFHNQTGWIHKSLLKGDRYVIISYQNLQKYNLHNQPNGKIIGLINKNNIVELKKCLIDWCLINYDGNLGWILKKNLWGVYKKEIYNINHTQPIIELYWKINESISKYIIPLIYNK